MKIQILLALAVFFLSVRYSTGQNDSALAEPLRKELLQLIESFDARVGVALLHIESGDTLTINNAYPYPMQSVYKFPLALAVLHEIDQNNLSPDQKLHLSKEDLRPDTWSPLAELYPDGNIDMTLAELLIYTVSRSDNNTCDVLFELMHGPKEIEKYVHELGYSNIAIQTTEAEMAMDEVSGQEKNWCQPYDMVKMLADFYKGKLLSKQSSQFLMQLMIYSYNSENRIKGLLPELAITAHKTGSGIRVVNDIGIITLPDGNHLAISVFACKSAREFEETEQLIAQISRVAYDFFVPDAELAEALDSVLLAKVKKRFNGVILVSKEDTPVYFRLVGYSDLTQKVDLEKNSRFCIGSISKQFTAVLALREYEQGRLGLDVPIRNYLPELTQTWADTVTVTHLLGHTHGIVSPDEPVVFKAGTQFSYSQLGYDLVAQIIERTSGKSFSELSAHLFEACGMNHTFYPSGNAYDSLVNGYSERPDGTKFIDTSWREVYPAAGGFISTAPDLVLWNKSLHSGKLLDPATYSMMIARQKNAIRQHPVFGETFYGMGITVEGNEENLQLGQTGFLPGFVSMNFYFPQTKTSVVVLQNVAYDVDDFRKTFYHHTEILKIVRRYL